MTYKCRSLEQSRIKSCFAQTVSSNDNLLLSLKRTFLIVKCHDISWLSSNTFRKRHDSFCLSRFQAVCNPLHVCLPSCLHASTTFYKRLFNLAKQLFNSSRIIPQNCWTQQLVYVNKSPMESTQLASVHHLFGLHFPCQTGDGASMRKSAKIRLTPQRLGRRLRLHRFLQFIS